MTLADRTRPRRPTRLEAGIAMACALGSWSHGAEATLIHTNVSALLSGGSSRTYSLDIDGNGVDDLAFTYGTRSSSVTYTTDSWLDVSPLGGTGFTYGGPLSAGRLIDDGMGYTSAQRLIDASITSRPGHLVSCGFKGTSLCYVPGTVSSSYSGTWNVLGQDPIVGYLGFRLTSGLDTHYGWMHLSLAADASPSYLLDYAYETCSGVGVEAGSTTSLCTSSTSPTSAVPEPSPLDLIVLGAAGMALGRRRRARRQAGEAPGVA